MNYKVIIKTLGKVLLVEAFLLLFPMIIGFIYGEQNVYGSKSYTSFLYPIAGLIIVGISLSLIKTKDNSIYAKEGFVLVASSWVIMSLIGALPFVISGCIPNYIDALFETVSGFTTTGASVLEEVESLPNSMNFWRLFTHFIGGMGVLVFVLAILPNTSIGAMHIYRAESPGPTAGKLVSKMKFTARILYLIYVCLTLIEFIMLVFDMPVFDALVHSFATAGTGGFSIKNQSIGYYSSYSQWVIASFMFLFSLNFNVFYLILIGSFSKAIKNEELIVFAIIVFLATTLITVDLLVTDAISVGFSEALRLSFFQVTSLSSSTGFSTTNYDMWPTLAKSILLFLMLFGACAGSTGGGMKISRLIILIKSSFADLRKSSHPREIISVKFNGEPVEQDTIKNVRNYFVLWFLLVVITTVILSVSANFDGESNLITSLSASLACIGNIGPGFGFVGPAMNYAGLTVFSKIWLSFIMLAGRLEILPMLILFAPNTWSKK